MCVQDWAVAYHCSQCPWLLGRTDKLPEHLCLFSSWCLISDKQQCGCCYTSSQYLAFGRHCPIFPLNAELFPIPIWSRSQTFPLCPFVSLTQCLEARIRAGGLLCALTIWGRWRTVASRTSTICHCLLQLSAALCCISGADRAAFPDPSSVLLLLEMRLGNTEKFLCVKYLFFMGNNIRNRVNIWKAF